MKTLTILENFESLTDAIDSIEKLKKEREYYDESETRRKVRLHKNAGVCNYMKCDDGNLYYFITADDGLVLLNRFDYVSSLNNYPFAGVNFKEKDGKIEIHCGKNEVRYSRTKQSRKILAEKNIWVTTQF